MSVDRSNQSNPEEAMSSTARGVGEAAERMGDSLAELQRMLTERTRECIENTDAYVRDNPWQAIGIGAGLGLVVGLLIGRR